MGAADHSLVNSVQIMVQRDPKREEPPDNAVAPQDRDPVMPVKPNQVYPCVSAVPEPTPSTRRGTVYLLSRFSLSLLYRPVRRGPDELVIDRFHQADWPFNPVCVAGMTIRCATAAITAW